MMKFILCDDDLVCNLYTKKIVESIIYENSMEAKVEFVTQYPEKVLDFIKSQKNLNKEYVNIYFLDIEMSPCNGIILANKIREMDKIGYLVFIASGEKCIKECSKVKTYRYLAKPTTKYEIHDLIKDIYKDYVNTFMALEIEAIERVDK